MAMKYLNLFNRCLAYGYGTLMPFHHLHQPMIVVVSGSTKDTLPSGVVHAAHQCGQARDLDAFVVELMKGRVD
jgi:hypothetical protein